jgi:hypothetical protein
MERAPLVNTTEQLAFSRLGHRPIPEPKDRPQLTFNAVVHEDAVHEQRAPVDVVKDPLIVAETSAGLRFSSLFALSAETLTTSLDGPALGVNDVSRNEFGPTLRGGTSGYQQRLRPKQPAGH